MKGTIKFFNDEKGFGFISGEDGKDVFVHQTELGGATVKEGDSVTFEVAQGDKGPKAVKVVKGTSEAKESDVEEVKAEAELEEPKTEEVAKE